MTCRAGKGIVGMGTMAREGGPAMDLAILIAIDVLLLALFPALGWWSLRCLRKAPDFPHKREMIWGAKYGWLIWELFAVLPVIAGPLMVRFHVPWALTVSTAWMLLIPLVTVANMLAYWPGIGSGVAIRIRGARMRGEEFDWDEFIARQEAQRRAWWLRLGVALFILFIPVWAYFVVTRIVPADRVVQAGQWSSRVEARMESAMADLPTTEVIVGREVFSGMKRPVPEGMHDNSVLIALRADASEDVQREAIARAEQVLASEHTPLEWYIRVRAEGQKLIEEMWRGERPG